MDQGSLKPESYRQNQMRIKGISLNLQDANTLSAFKKGRSRDRALKKKYRWKFGQELPGIIEYMLPKQVEKLANSKAELYDACMQVIDGYPGSELFEIYRDMMKTKTPYGKIQYVLGFR